MPNHETNTVVITGEPAKVEKFIAEALRDYQEGDNRYGDERPEKVIDFTQIIPQPDNIETDGCPHIGFNPEINPDFTYTDSDGKERVCWYAWNIENWGTKWGAYSHTHYELRTLKSYDGVGCARVDLRFETAWSQPKPIFMAIENRWGVTVHAVTVDEGGADDVIFGDPYGEEVIEREVTMNFANYDKEN